MHHTAIGLASILAMGGCQLLNEEDGEEEPLEITAAPENLTAMAVSPDAVELTWEDRSDDEDGFEVQWSYDAVGPFERLATLEADVTRYDADGLMPDTTFYFRLIAFGPMGDSEPSELDEATTLGLDWIAPEKPGNLAHSWRGPEAIELEWWDQSNNEAGFIVERADSAESPFVEIGTTEQNIRHFSDDTVTDDTAYFYRARAFNASGDSELSNILETHSRPYHPTSFTATLVSSNIIEMTWVDNTDTETAFKIDRTCPSLTIIESALLCDKTYVRDADQETFNIAVLSGWTYAYRIRAVTPTLDSLVSQWVTVDVP